MKIRVNLSVDSDKLEMAKTKKLNLSFLLDKMLDRELDLPSGEYDLKRRRLELEKEIKAKEMEKIDKELSEVNHKVDRITKTQKEAEDAIRRKTEPKQEEPKKTREELFASEIKEHWPYAVKAKFLTTDKKRQDYFSTRARYLTSICDTPITREDYMQNVVKICERKGVM